MDGLAGYFDMLYKLSVMLGFTIFLIKLPAWITCFRLGAKKDLFECRMCGNCCRFNIIDVNKKDVERFRADGYSEFTDENEKMMKRVNGRCIFLEDDKCSAHKSRGKVCREFPFQRIYGRWFCQEVQFCPGVDDLKKKL
ncbi:MAG TPA: YkgJ family cysteine cluster protein [Candidatus Altiarchaeales archaeon]|nr:YkgJ family cysteine cluster protein [Candidatus Altiarchaeales archaeon]